MSASEPLWGAIARTCFIVLTCGNNNYTQRHFSTSAKDEAMACIPLKLFNEATHYCSNQTPAMVIRSRGMNPVPL